MGTDCGVLVQWKYFPHIVCCVFFCVFFFGGGGGIGGETSDMQIPFLCSSEHTKTKTS